MIERPEQICTLVLLQVPSLPDQPPNFLVAANLRDHVTPVAVVPEQEPVYSLN